MTDADRLGRLRQHLADARTIETHPARVASIALGHAATEYGDRLDGQTLDDIGRIIYELDRLADEDRAS